MKRARLWAAAACAAVAILACVACSELGLGDKYTLTIKVSPDAAGTVSQAASSLTYAKGMIALLTATPAEGYVFDHWSGDASGPVPVCGVEMTADRTVTAVFAVPTAGQVVLSTSSYPNLGGTITLSSAGSVMDKDTTVTLTATPATGYAFVHWEGDLAGTVASTNLAMIHDMSVKAVFKYVGTGGALQAGQLSLTGAVTTVAGARGIAGTFDGIGTGALFNSPRQCTRVGNYLYIADWSNHRIRKLDLTTMAVSTFSGSGIAGHVDGYATSACFNCPDGICSDGTAFLYVSDIGSHTIRQVSLADGSVTTIAGSNTAGWVDADGTQASFNGPYGICYVGPASACLYVADTANQRIRKVDLSTTAHAVTTIAGSGSAGWADGTGVAASFNNPYGISWDGTSLWVTDYSNHVIRKVTPAGVVTTPFGLNGTADRVDGTGNNARFYYPRGITLYGGYLYVGDHGSNSIRRVQLTSPYQVDTLAGGTAGWADGNSGIARFTTPTGFSVSADGLKLYIVEENHLVRSMSLVSGTLGTTTSIAGSHGVAGYSNGTGVGALLNTPEGACSDGTYVYFVEYGSATVRKLEIATGAVSLIAGAANAGGSTDGAGAAASFNQPHGITKIDNYLYVCDSYNHTIRRIDLGNNCMVSTIAGSAGQGGFVNASGNSARFSYPFDITNDGANLYVTDHNNGAIRKIDLANGNAVTTLAGFGYAGYDEGIGTAARFNYPTYITTDGKKLFVSDRDNRVIRTVDPLSGETSLLAGMPGVAGNADGVGAYARFRNPHGITCDGTALYVADISAHTIRRVIIATGEVTTLAGLDSVTGVAVDGTGSAARFNAPHAITTDGTSLFICDSGNHAMRRIQ